MSSKSCEIHENDHYDTSNPCYGVALIFNQVNFEDKENEVRHGSEKDELDLKFLLEKIGFDVRVFRDEKAENIKKKLEEGTYVLTFCLQKRK